MNNKMLEPTVIVSWCPQDLINEYGFTEEQAVDILNEISKGLENDQIAAGWATLHTLVNEYMAGEQDVEEENND
jgi:hypothetical protein